MGGFQSLCMNTLDKIEVDITVELGATRMPIHHLLRMGRGAVIELDATESDPLRIYANRTLIAHGEVKVDNGQLSVRVTEKLMRRS
jgi:flagellar motor switch protein FliN